MNKQREACVAAAREHLCFSARLRAKEMLRFPATTTLSRSASTTLVPPQATGDVIPAQHTQTDGHPHAHVCPAPRSCNAMWARSQSRDRRRGESSGQPSASVFLASPQPPRRLPCHSLHPPPKRISHHPGPSSRRHRGTQGSDGAGQLQLVSGDHGMRCHP